MDDNKSNLKKDISLRLRKIEGQVKGIQKMVDSGSCCKDILVQIAAVRAAINKVGGPVSYTHLDVYKRQVLIREYYMWRD